LIKINENSWLAFSSCFSLDVLGDLIHRFYLISLYIFVPFLIQS
jgi:hypothetical protein